jgi:hypothetical protein
MVNNFNKKAFYQSFIANDRIKNTKKIPKELTKLERKYRDKAKGSCSKTQ